MNTEPNLSSWSHEKSSSMKILISFLMLCLALSCHIDSVAANAAVLFKFKQRRIKETCHFSMRPPSSSPIITCTALPHYPGAKVLQMGHYPEDFSGPGLLANTEGFLSRQSTQDYLASGISDWIAVPSRTGHLDQEDDAIQLNEYGVDFLWARQPDEIKREKIHGKDWTGYLWTRRTEPTRNEMGDLAPKRPQRCFIALLGNQKNSLEFATCLARDRNPREPNELHYRDFMRALKSIEFGR
ncbi:hypothetical protein HBDW_01790 [Herbaspirillum sp. DW155]|uniref:hypothetical protein n=1 Tax=Herbaspirillum sp. DW155 TaxID=3095609 RepID=UPI00308E1A3E|nr:hypothetical protein HBDW_01790 [Herbaspirillum sp. DW155]